MVLGQVFLKKGVGLALWLFNFFSRFIILHLEIALSVAKLFHAFEEKNYLFLPL